MAVPHLLGLQSFSAHRFQDCSQGSISDHCVLISSANLQLPLFSNSLPHTNGVIKIVFLPPTHWLVFIVLKDGREQIRHQNWEEHNGPHAKTFWKRIHLQKLHPQHLAGAPVHPVLPPPCGWNPVPSAYSALPGPIPSLDNTYCSRCLGKEVTTSGSISQLLKRVSNGP